MSHELQETLVSPRAFPGAFDAPASPTETLPHDLLIDSIKRLRVISLVFAFVFFMANFFPILLDVVIDAVPDDSVQFFYTPSRWLPGGLSIIVALVVFVMTRSPRFSTRTLMHVGLVFGALGSYGIAFAEYWGRLHFETDWHAAEEGIGLSWVGPWMILYAIVMPNPPRKTLVSAIVSASAVPAVFALALATGWTTLSLQPFLFVAGLVFPYLLCVLMAVSGAWVVYKLGREIREARELGSYRLVEKLGQGGMGEVWRARHRMLARPAAIKLIRPELLGASSLDKQSELLRRFEREAQATAALNCPHTVALYDFGIANDGTFYTVMELLDGLDLESLVRQFGPVVPERAVYLLKQMCSSLAEAHENGLTHRDIKPANVYVCRYGREVDFVKVLDFGLVKATDETTLDPMQTAEHVQGGTPAFMAPEQVLGNRPLDGRADLYAVGCVGFWLLTGQLVFEGDTVMQTMLKHVQEAPAPPSSRSEFAVPAALDDAILACLQKAPEQRPESADALLELLGSSTIPTGWTPERAHTWWETHAPQRRT
jgi:serine/threonine-protein kinase